MNLIVSTEMFLGKFQRNDIKKTRAKSCKGNASSINSPNIVILALCISNLLRFQSQRIIFHLMPFGLTTFVFFFLFRYRRSS